MAIDALGRHRPKAMEAMDGGAWLEDISGHGKQAAVVAMARMSSDRLVRRDLEPLARRLIAASSEAARDKALLACARFAQDQWLTRLLLESGARLRGSWCLVDLLSMRQAPMRTGMRLLRKAGWKPSGERDETGLIENIIQVGYRLALQDVLDVYIEEGIDLPRPTTKYDSWFHRAAMRVQENNEATRTVATPRDLVAKQRARG